MRKTKTKMKGINIIIILSLTLIAFTSCKKPVTQSYTPSPQDYIGKWKYEVWINDTTEENKYFGLELRNAGNDSIEGLFCSVWLNGDRLDGSNADEETTTNVWGKFVNDSLYVNVQGGRWEDASAKAVMYLINDSSLLWKTISEKGEIFIPDSVILKRECDSIKNAKEDSVTEPIDTSNVLPNDTSVVQLKGELSAYSVNWEETCEVGKSWGNISLMKNGKTISKINLPENVGQGHFYLNEVESTDKGFSFHIAYGHSRHFYEQTFVFEYINGDFYLTKTIDYRSFETEDGFDLKKSENKLKEPIPFSKMNIEKLMLI
jgi:hypothetical protein